MKNPFRNPVMRGSFDDCIRMYVKRHRNFFLTSNVTGELIRNESNSIATWFWRGYDGVKLCGWFVNSSDRNNTAYAYWRAGQAAKKEFPDDRF